ncbi:MAG: DUF4446 family protein [Actinomycetes bacterium]
MTSLGLDPDLVAIIAIAAAAVALIGLVLVVILALRVKRLRRQYVILQAGDDGQSFMDAVSRQNDGVTQMCAEVASLSSSVDSLRVDLADAIRHVAVVRYDAFNDMGGRMSFSAALLDDAGDGVVISSINGRSETRTYAKGVKGGVSEADLSPEEVQVIDYARASHPRS